MIVIIKHLLSFLIAYLIGLIVYGKLNTTIKKDYIIYKIHSFFIGIGTTSLLFWFFTVLTNGQNKFYPLFEIILASLLFIKTKKTNIKALSLKEIRIFTKRNFITFILFTLIFTYIYYYSSILPNGTCDAFYMFNYKAKYLAYEKPAFWYGIFSEHLSDSHLDYPLFLPSIVARFAVYTNGYNDLSPAILTIIFSFSIFLQLYTYLYKLKDWYHAIVAICILSASEKFIFYSVWQCSDIPLALYILISIYELVIWTKTNGDKKLPLTAIYCSSIVLWIKNEGAVFFLLFIIIIIIFGIKQRINIKNFLKSWIVLCPSFFALILLHIFYTEPNDLLDKLFSRLNGFYELYRYYYLLMFIYYFIYRNIWLIAIPFLFLKKYTSVHYSNLRVLLIIPSISYIIYCSTYFITPHNFYWHIQNSFDRIMLHYIPMLLFYFLLLIPSERLMLSLDKTQTRD